MYCIVIAFGGDFVKVIFLNKINKFKGKFFSSYRKVYKVFIGGTMQIMGKLQN